MFKTEMIEGVVVKDLKYIDDRSWLAEIFREDEVDPQYRPVWSTFP